MNKYKHSMIWTFSSKHSTIWALYGFLNDIPSSVCLPEGSSTKIPQNRCLCAYGLNKCSAD
jgi:hypothetical protein